MKARDIQWALATAWSSPFRARRHTAVVPNVSWALLPWEADLLVVTGSDYLVEIEIKCHITDWRNDKAKEKWKGRWTKDNFPAIGSIRRFYYACPAKLAARHQEIEMPPGCGVIAVHEDGVGAYKIETLVEAETRMPASKLSPGAINLLLRLAAIKAWGLEHHPSRAPKEQVEGGAA